MFGIITFTWILIFIVFPTIAIPIDCHGKQNDNDKECQQLSDAEKHSRDNAISIRDDHNLSNQSTIDLKESLHLEEQMRGVSK